MRLFPLTVTVLTGLSLLVSCDTFHLDKLSWCIWGTDVSPTTSLTGCDEPWHRAESCICVTPELEP